MVSKYGNLIAKSIFFSCIFQEAILITMSALQSKLCPKDGS